MFLVPVLECLNRGDVADGVRWQETQRGVELPLTQSTRTFGAASLLIEAGDAWITDQALWLVENQALFDQADWLPAGTVATVLYYGGQINSILLNWLGSRTQAGRVVHFSDYDGVGLANFVRLHALLNEACECWLMPDWSIKLERYGSAQLWRDTLRDFSRVSSQLPEYLAPLAQQMRHSGLAHEQEAVWLPGETWHVSYKLCAGAVKQRCNGRRAIDSRPPGNH